VADPAPRRKVIGAAPRDVPVVSSPGRQGRGGHFGSWGRGFLAAGQPGLEARDPRALMAGSRQIPGLIEGGASINGHSFHLAGRSMIQAGAGDRDPPEDTQ